MRAQKTKRQRGAGHLFLRGHVWWAQYYLHGHKVRVSCQTEDEKKAAKFLKRKLAEVETGTHGDTHNLTYDNLRDALLADFEANGRKSLRKDREGNLYIDCVKRLDDFFAGYKAREIDAESVRRFQKHYKAKELSNGSINRSVSALRRMFSLARREERLRDVPYFPFLKESAPRSGFIERTDYERLYSALSGHLRPVVALGFWTGMRRAEILNLKWEQVDFIGGTIRLQAGTTKNDAPRTIPIVAPLRTVLLLQFKERQTACPYVCYSLDRRGQAGRIISFRKAWQNTCVRLGLGNWKLTGETEIRVDRPRSKPKEKREYEGLLFHDLRRSCVRNLVRARVPERIARQISGHKSRAVFDRYDIVSENDLMNAGRQLETYFEKFGHNSDTEMLQDEAVSFVKQ